MKHKKINQLTDDAWNKQRCIAVDVDGTLVFWENNLGPGDPGGNWKPNQLLIDRLIAWKTGNINRELIVWSGNRREHATRMVLALGLTGVVNYVMSKPTMMMEDHPFWFDANTTMVDVREQWPTENTDE